MKIEYTIKGITLNATDLVNIHSYYEAATTAEYILENCDIGTDDKEALRLGYMVREVMDKDYMSENDAINKVLSHEKYNT